MATFCQAFKLNTKRAYGFGSLKSQAGFHMPIDTKGLGILGRFATSAVRPSAKDAPALEKRKYLSALEDSKSKFFQAAFLQDGLKVFHFTCRAICIGLGFVMFVDKRLSL